MWPVLLMALLVAPEPRVVQWASPTQATAFQYGPFPQLASGGFGSGKTFLYCLKALWLSDTFPKNRGAIFRRVAKDLRQTTMATFRKICPPSAYQYGAWNMHEGITRLNNGSEILWLHMDDPETESVIKGLEINWFFGDQLEENPEQMEEIWDLLLSRLGRWDQADVPQWMIDHERAQGREWPWVHPVSGKPTPPQYAMGACNPDTELHWLYRRFHPDSDQHAKYQALGYKLFHMPSLENQYLTDQNRANLLSQDEAFVRRYVRGEWGLPEGAIHTIDATSYVDGSPELLEYFRRACTLQRWLDHGDSSPTCCLWTAVDRNSNVFFYREYYVPNQMISYHRREITALSEGERYDLSQADPSIFHRVQKLGSGPVSDNKEHGGKWSVADEYGDVVMLPRDTALYWTPADNNERGTRNRINEYLRVEPERIHPITLQKGAPRLYFVKANASYPHGCAQVIKETRSQRRLKIGTEMGRPVFSDERDPDIPDHAYDPLRYCIASRPPVATDPRLVAGVNTFMGRRKMAIQAQRALHVRGRQG
jgi:hypothetical protein